MNLRVLLPQQYNNIEFYKIKYKKSGQVDVTAIQ